MSELHLLSYKGRDAYEKTMNMLDVTCPQAVSSSNSSGKVSAMTALFHSMLRCAANKAKSLQVLRCEFNNVIPGMAFPVLSHLKHLMLIITKDVVGFPPLDVALPQMQRLLTVHLDKPHDDGGCAEVPLLDLRPCGELQSLRLGNVAPAGMLLPSTCILHLDICYAELGFAPVWESVRSVGSLYYNMDQPGENQYLGSVPLFNSLAALDTVSLDECNEDIAMRLPPAVVGARRVTIRGFNVELEIPASHAWEVLEIYSYGSLRLEFEDLDAFSRAPPAFTIECAKVKGTGLWDLMKALGKEWHMRERFRRCMKSRRLSTCIFAIAASLAAALGAILQMTRRTGQPGMWQSAAAVHAQTALLPPAKCAANALLGREN